MDFRQTLQANANRVEQAPAAPSGNNNQKKNLSSKLKEAKWMKLLSIVVLAGAAIILLGVAVVFIRGNVNEGQYLKTKQYQAVFLSNGQVYFGKVKALGSESIVLNDVFYLTQNSTGTTATTASGSDYTLVKLGCQQIHYPNDQMVVNRSQVTFWENLNADGKVVKSINEFKKQNPSGQNCTSTTNDTQSTTSGTSATQNSTGSTPSSNTSKTNQ